MPKKKCKLTSAEKRAERERKKKWMHIFINGKQKRVLRPEPCEWEDDEWLRQNADPITLHLMERWDLMEPEPAFEPILQPATIEELFPDYEPRTLQILSPWGKEEPAVIREYLSDFDEESATITEFIVYLDSDVFDDFIPPGMMSDDDIPF